MSCHLPHLYGGMLTQILSGMIMIVVKDFMVVNVVWCNFLLFFSVGEYGDVSSLNGGGEPFDHGSWAPHRVRPPLHLKLHLYLRKHQRQIHAGEQIKHKFLNNLASSWFFWLCTIWYNFTKVSFFGHNQDLYQLFLMVSWMWQTRRRPCITVDPESRC